MTTDDCTGATNDPWCKCCNERVDKKVSAERERIVRLIGKRINRLEQDCIECKEQTNCYRCGWKGKISDLVELRAEIEQCSSEEHAHASKRRIEKEVKE